MNHGQIRVGSIRGSFIVFLHDTEDEALGRADSIVDVQVLPLIQFHVASLALTLGVVALNLSLTPHHTPCFLRTFGLLRVIIIVRGEVQVRCLLRCECVWSQSMLPLDRLSALLHNLRALDPAYRRVQLLRLIALLPVEQGLVGMELLGADSIA